MTHNLLIYPSTLPGEPLERYKAEGVTLEEWLATNVPSFAPGRNQPISATVNGAVVPPDEWSAVLIGADTLVELRPQPQGIETAIIAAVVAVVAVAATVLLAPSIPSQNRNRSSRGSSIYEANAQGNSPKLGDVIPEIAGRHKTFPDYLTAPRRYFVDTTTQALDLLLCVGRGEYTIPDAEIKIGSTPIGSLGSDVDYQVFEPGESVSGHVAHRRWFNAPEVGASTGSSGLRLKSGNNFTQSLSASAVELSGQDIVVPTGAGTAPKDWEAGMLLIVNLLQEIDVTDGGQDGSGNYLRDVLSGDFPAFSSGEGITISGGSSIGGDYLVNSYTAGVDPDLDELALDNANSTPAAFLSPGMYMAAIDYTGVRYRIESIITEDYEVEVTNTETDENGETTTTTTTETRTRRIGFTVSRLNPDGTVDTGWPGFASQTTSDISVRLDDTAINSDWAGPFLACPEGEVTSRIEWDILAPQGLGKINDDGNIQSRSRTVQLQYRPLGDSEWTTASESISGATRNQLGWTFVVNLPASMTPEVRVRRTSQENTSTQAIDRLEWYGLRSELPGAPSSYPGVTVLALTLIGSDTIASQTENQVSVVATRRLPVRENGEWQPAQATRDIAPWVVHVAKSIGYDDSQIDYDELDRLDATWKARGDYYDRVHDDDSTVKEVLNSSLRAGMSELTIDQGRIRPVRDEPRSTLEHMYTPQNMTGPLKRSVTAPRPDDPDGVDVEYFSSETWSSETIECRLPGDLGIKVEKLSVDGVTSRTQAWRIGMRERRKMKYRRWQYSFETELDALNSRYMSYCALADDVPGYGQSAILEDVINEGSTARLIVSEPLEWTAGEGHVIAWRRPDGTFAGPYAATQGSNEYEVLAPLDEWPDPHARQEPPHVLFGTAERWSYPVLVTDINPQGFEGVSVEAMNYDERIYADDDASPP